MHTKTTFSQSLQKWQTPAFTETLKREIADLESGVLPLQKAVSQGAYVNDSNIACCILSSTETDNNIVIKAAVFFTEMVPSCSCGDDPLEINGYCDMQIRIDKQSAVTHFILLNNSPDSDI